MSSVIKRSEKHFKLQKQTVFRYTIRQLENSQCTVRWVGLSACQVVSQKMKIRKQTTNLK